MTNYLRHILIRDGGIIGYDGSNPTKTGAVKGYHPKDYSFPRNSKEQFEIIMGSVLTQNTSWPFSRKSIK